MDEKTSAAGFGGSTGGAGAGAGGDFPQPYPQAISPQGFDAVTAAAAEGEALVRSAWRWTAATVLLLPILLFWSLPNAALVGQRLARGEVAAAAEAATTCRKLGIAAIVVTVAAVLLWIVLMVAVVATGVDAVDSAT